MGPEEPGGYFQPAKVRGWKKGEDATWEQTRPLAQESQIMDFPPFSIAIGCCSVKETYFETSSLFFLQLGSVRVSPGWSLQQEAVTEWWLSAWWRSPPS